MKKILFMVCVGSILVTESGLRPAKADFIKTPIYDQDKYVISDNSCWLASAANMLAAAGYAGGSATTIYDRLLAKYPGGGGGGLQDIALRCYLANYPEPGNPYTVAQGYWGDLYANPDFILEELKRCQYVGIGFWWGASLGHAITVWGDNESALRQGYFSDSDRDDGGDYTWYTWADHGGGDWFLDDYFSSPIANVNYVATLCQVPLPASLILAAMGLSTAGGILHRRKTSS